MPRIHDARNDSSAVILLRGIVFLVACTFAVVMLQQAGHMMGDPTSAFARYREPAVMPHVFVHGTIHQRSDMSKSLGPMCVAEHERWQACGKSHCWKSIESFSYSSARIDITGSSSPLPSTMNLSYAFQFEPWSPGRHVADGDKEKAWRAISDGTHGFRIAFNGPSSDRVAESCLTDDDPVTIEACVSPTTPGLLEPCAGQPRYGVIFNGEPQAALDDAADDVARYLGGAAAALFVAMFAWMKSRKPIMAGLEDRAAPHRKTLDLAWALFGVPPVLIAATVLMHGYHPPSTWSTGRGGFAFAISVLCVWLFFALNRWLHRRRTLFALAPVLATPRSLLAEANGTVELAVKASGKDLRSFIGDEEIAFSEIVINETFRAGRNTSTQEVYRGRLRDHLAVVDESGEGRLDLSNAILDVEERTLTMPQLSPRYHERGVPPGQHPKHVSFIVKEWIIRDQEPLYVFGDVSGIALQASEGGYRTVRGSPTLGGKDAAPVLVHSGDERGLIQLLSREARIANSYAVVAACMCTAIAATLVALARF